MKNIKYFAVIVFSCFFLISCDSGIFLPTKGGISKKLKGTWTRYTFSEIGDTDVWTIDGTNISSEFHRKEFSSSATESSTYTVEANLVSAFLTIDNDLHKNGFARKWEILRLKEDILVLSSEDSGAQQLLEFEKQ